MATLNCKLQSNSRVSGKALIKLLICNINLIGVEFAVSPVKQQLYWGSVMPKAVFILLDSSGCGGIESHVMVLAKALASHCQVTVLLWRVYREPHPLLSRLAELGIAYEVLDGSVRQLIGLWRAHPEAVLHCHGYKANLLGRIAGFLLDRRCICTFHNGDIGEGRIRFYTWLDEWSSRFSLNIAVSQAIANRLSHHCLLMPNTVDVATEIELTADKAGVVGFVGRLEQVKRPDRFVALARQFNAASFGVWGSGSLANVLQQKQPLNLTLFGAVADMNPYWPQIDVLIICSDYEGFPMVALEAMGAGVPVIALPLGDLPALISHGDNGFLARDETELSVCLTTWLALPATQRLKIRQNARQTVSSSYSSKQLWSRLLPLYQSR